MTVLHVIEPFASGVTTFLIHITRHLPQHHHIVLHSTRTSVDQLNHVRNRFSPKVEFVKWENAQREISIWNDLKSLYFLLKFIKKTNPDCIHLHSSKAGFLGRLACFFLRRSNSLYTPHSASFLRTDINFFTKNLYINLERFAYYLNGQVICCCEAEQKAHQKIGIDAKCINNGTPNVFVDKSNSEIITIIFSGLITKQKNPVLFNQIAAMLQSEKNIKFYWIGDGELRSALSSPNIHVTGWLEKTEISRYHQEASIYLSTSDWEGLPYGVLEAMTASCCLLLSKTGGHLDLVHENRNGFLFNTAEEAIAHIHYLIQNTNLIKQMGGASKKLVKKEFEVQRMANEYNELYLTLSSSKK